MTNNVRISELVGQATNHVGTLTVTAVAAGQAAGDIGFIGDVAGIECRSPVIGIVGQHRVKQRDGWNIQRTAFILVVADITHPAADLEAIVFGDAEFIGRSEEHTSELQSLMRISYAVFCLKKTKK